MKKELANVWIEFHGRLITRNEVFNWRGIGATRVQLYKSLSGLLVLNCLWYFTFNGYRDNPICDTLLFHVDNWIEKMCLRCNLIDADANIIFPLSCRLAHTSLGFDVLWEWSSANWSGNHLYQMILFTDRIWLVWHSSEQVNMYTYSQLSEVGNTRTYLQTREKVLEW